MGNLLGCPDCGAGNGEIRSGKKIPHKDELVEKINEIIDWINEHKDQKSEKSRF